MHNTTVKMTTKLYCSFLLNQSTLLELIKTKPGSHRRTTRIAEADLYRPSVLRATQVTVSKH